MKGPNWLAQRFEENRARLTKVAVRMLGSASEAEDAVQETWLRVSRADAGTIDNLTAWLTTVVGRICLDMLRSRRARREERLDVDVHSQLADVRVADPEREAILADSIGPALLVVLDTLNPAERVAFVLHDMFGMPFEGIGAVVGRSEAAARKLASRARRRVRGSSEDGVSRPKRAEPVGGTPVGGGDMPPGRTNERRIVDAFLAAARGGDFERLLSVLDPDCVLRSDELASSMGSPRRVDGRDGVAGFFNGRSAGARRATVAGAAAAAWAPGGAVRVAFRFGFRNERIVDIELIADRERLKELGVALLDS